MNNLKKIIAAFLSAMLISSALCTVSYAADDFDAELFYDMADSTYLVSGTLAGDKGNVPMLLTVQNSNGDFFTGFQTLAKRNGETVTFDFEPLSFPFDAETDEYTLTVSSEFYSHTVNFDISVLSIVSQYEFMKDLNELMENSGTGICNLTADKAEYLNLDATEFELKPASKAVYDTFLTEPYDLPEELVGTDEDSIAKVQESWKKCCADSFNALAAAAFVDIESADGCAKWIDNYYEKLKLDKENESTDYSEKKINSYFDTVKEESTFIERIADITAVENTDDLADSIYEAVLLSAIETMKYTAVNDIFTNFPQFFEVDEDLYEELTSEELGNVFTKISGNSYKNYDAVADDFDKLADNMIDKRSDKKGSSGGSGSNLFFGNETVTQNPSQGTINNDELMDLSAAEWAREAIVHLVSRNVIQGRGNGLFDPNASITRAEFIKIVVVALDLSLDNGGCSFTDVNPDAWYYSVVSAAQNTGIVLGDDKNAFHPEDSISRQDMATILCRAFGFKGGNTASKFTDYNNISDYAKDAVDALCENGIINGMGNGTFAPFANATRAQAAQMIYKIIK